MKYLKYILSLTIFLLFTAFVQANYTMAPSCPDFTNLNGTYVVGTTGHTYDPFEKDTIATNRQTLITGQGTDVNTGNQLKLLPDGETQVIKLGNDLVGGEAESLTYHFIVDKDNPILLVKFAVVLQDPGHPKTDQPRFVMKVMDKDGMLIDDCAEYDVSSGGEIAGFKRYQSQQWRDWTNVGIDMSKFAGQEVQVQFTTYDCWLLAHYGYAYFTASCIPNKLSFSSCGTSDFTITAPAGFSSYLWDNGDTTLISKRTKSTQALTMSCLITSATGCQFTLSAYIDNQDVTASTADTIKDTICIGTDYKSGHFNIPASQLETGTQTITTNLLNASSCGGTATETLKLTVLPLYYNISSKICQGSNYEQNGFRIIQPPVGSYHDTLTYHRASGCDSIVCLELTVNTNYQLKDISISGNTSPCTNGITTYRIDNAEEGTTYTWDISSNTTILSQSASSITLTYNKNTVDMITVKGVNGCRSILKTLKINPLQSYYSYIEDSVCQGASYDKGDFQLGEQDTVGYFAHTHHYQTTSGCDSVFVLQLKVNSIPDLTILSSSTLFCDSSTATLNAVNKNINGYLPNDVAVGDIYCTDETTVRPDVFKSSGKTAEGVVAYVDNTGKHGYMIALSDITNIQWCAYTNSRYNVSKLIDYKGLDFTLDTAGYSNTKAIREANDNIVYPAAWSVDFENGWYIPAAAQMGYIYGICSTFLDNSLSIGGGIGVTSTTNYWASTEYDYWRALSIVSSTYLSPQAKTNSCSIRALKNF